LAAGSRELHAGSVCSPKKKTAGTVSVPAVSYYSC